MRGLVLGALLGAAAVPPRQTADPRGTTYAFVNVSVIPMDQPRVLARQTVVVRDGVILAVGPAGKTKIPAGAQRIDGTGRYLMPGLADMHTHVHVHYPVDAASDSIMLEQMLMLFIANGVTTIRNMQEVDTALRHRIDRGDVIGPKIYSASRRLYDFDPSGSEPIAFIPWPEQADSIIAREKAAGADFLKVYDIARLDVFDSVVASARRHGLPLAGHVTKSIGVSRALKVPYASVDHVVSYLNLESFSPVAETRDSQIAAFASTVKASGVWTVPTYTVYANNMLSPTEQRQLPGMVHVSRKRIAGWQGQNPGDLQLARLMIKALHDAGAGLLLGTDTPEGFNVPGFSVHRELEAMVEAGLTPYEALTTATVNVARFFGTLAEAGTVSAGKRADLVLLGGNPLDSIGHTARPIGVMVRGQWLARAEIDTRLRAIDASIR